MQPGPSAFSAPITTLTAFLSEPVNTSSLAGEVFGLTEAGADGTPGTTDDLVVSGGTLVWNETALALLLDFAGNLQAGLYAATVGPPLADQGGNVAAGVFQWGFRVYSETDSDGDGLPDDIETLLGLDPQSTDSDGDGTPDGLEDADGDGLANRYELLFGTNPLLQDTDGDGVFDGQGDADRDGLVDAQELAIGTDPFQRDTDGDRFEDGEEVEAGSNPLELLSLPLFAAVETVSVGNISGGLGYRVQQVSGLNQGGNPNHVGDQVTVRNAAAPEAVAQETVARVLSVNNAGTPP